MSRFWKGKGLIKFNRLENSRILSQIKLVLTCLSFLLSTASFAKYSGGITARKDLKEKLSSYLCGKNTIPSTESVWSLKIYDAQIEGKYYKSKSNSKISEDEMQIKAISLAKRHNHKGAAWGICSDGRGWTASVPSSTPLNLSKKTGKIELPIAALNKYCRDYLASFAPHDGGLSIDFKQSEKSIDISKLGTGVFGLTCLPKTPRWQGPVVWYLRPIGHITNMHAPLNYLLKDKNDKNNSEHLSLWINAIRKKENLPPLIYGYEVVNRGADTLAIGGSIMHNRKMISSIKAGLQEGHVKFVGENRVKANSLEAVATLLWNSPTHRNLLLSKEATHLGISMKRQDSELFAVLLFGDGSSLKISRADK